MMANRLGVRLIHQAVDCNDFDLVFGVHTCDWYLILLSMDKCPPLGFSTPPWYGGSNPSVNHLHAHVLSL